MLNVGSKLPPIDASEISVVVQGPIIGEPDAPVAERLTWQCLQSIRKHLPGAEIVLSTWPDAVVDGLDYDKLVQPEDPGGTFNDYRYNLRMLNNVNRQVVSTQAGLEAATRKYAMKFRSDMVLTGNGFLKYFGRFSERAPEWKIFKERLLTCTVYSRNPRRAFPFPFHPSDFCFFGYIEDVRLLWDVPFVTKGEIQWFRNRNRPWPAFDWENDSRYAPEQHIWISLLRKHGEVNVCQYAYDCSEEAIALSELSFANNLVFLNPKQLCVEWLKMKLLRKDWYSIYTHGEWVDLYRKYCCAGYRKPIVDPENLQKGWDTFSFAFANKARTQSRRYVTGFGFLLRLFILDFEGFRKGVDRLLPHGRLIQTNPERVNLIKQRAMHINNLVFRVWGKRLFVNAPRKVVRMVLGRPSES